MHVPCIGRLAAQPKPSLAVGPSEQLRFGFVSAERRSMQSAPLEVSVFLFCFSVFDDQAPDLTVSTRALLVIVVGLAATFALVGDSPLRSTLRGDRDRNVVRSVCMIDASH